VATSKKPAPPLPRVLFVSKPIAPPWNDGSKNLVRDVARHLTRAEATVLSTPDAPEVGGGARMDRIYTAPGTFAPGLVQNARVVRRLLTGDAHDVWHFVFAPNPASSTVARFTSRTRRMLGWKGSVVQTVASAPRSFDGVAQWIFGDVVVVVSDWMRGRLLGAGVKRDLHVIPPCAEAPSVPTRAAIEGARSKLGVGSAPIVLYPGDYEVSHGAATVARSVSRIVKGVPGARVVFACRAKTAKSAGARALVEGDLRAAGLLDRTVHAGEVDDMAALLAASTVVAFPVDDLYGKVDVPLVLLEALALGIPVVAARGGPLETISAARFVDPEDDAALAAEVTRFLTDTAAAAEAAKRGRALYDSRFSPRVVAAAYEELYTQPLRPPPDSAR
jgi:phosphatidylinositol alpha-1,6-mannosyltransferase